MNFCLLISFIVFTVVACQKKEFFDYFSSCHVNDASFDSCMRDALNGIRPFFKKGLPEYNVPPFDPFFAKEVPQKRGGPTFNYKLLLKDVYESGWTISQVTNFKSNLKKNMVQYTQFFPDKRLHGNYEITGSVLGRKFNNKGNWSLELFDFVQTSMVTRKPRNINNGTDALYKVSINVQTCKDLKLHISNLLQGRSVLERMLDQIINTAWQPGFVVLKPIINDLVGTAFTEIFSRSFKNFPFNELYK